MATITVGCFWFSSAVIFPTFVMSWILIKFAQACAWITITKVSSDWFSDGVIERILGVLYWFYLL
jgi:hypothetical protein